jgi:hypothetical protein
LVVGDVAAEAGLVGQCDGCFVVTGASIAVLRQDVWSQTLTTTSISGCVPDEAEAGIANAGSSISCDCVFSSGNAAVKAAAFGGFHIASRTSANAGLSDIVPDEGVGRDTAAFGSVASESDIVAIGETSAVKAVSVSNIDGNCGAADTSLIVWVVDFRKGAIADACLQFGVPDKGGIEASTSRGVG